MSINLLDLFGLLPFNKRSPTFILVSLYVHQSSICGLGVCCSEELKLSPTLESSIFIACLAIIASQYNWWPQKLIPFKIINVIVMVIYNSWISLILANLAEIFFLVPLHNLTFVISYTVANKAIEITGIEWDSVELTEKIGCMMLLVLSLAFLFYTLTNSGGVSEFIRDFKRYVRERLERRRLKSMAIGCSTNFEDDEYDEPPCHVRQRRRKKAADCRQVSLRRCQLSL